MIQSKSPLLHRMFEKGSTGSDGKVRSSLVRLDDRDGKFLAETLTLQSTELKPYPIDETDMKKLATHTVNRPDKVAPVCRCPRFRVVVTTQQAREIETREVKAKLRALIPWVRRGVVRSGFLTPTERLCSKSGRPMVRTSFSAFRSTMTIPLSERSSRLTCSGCGGGRSSGLLKWSTQPRCIRASCAWLTSWPFSQTWTSSYISSLPRLSAKRSSKRFAAPCSLLLEKGPLAESCTYLSYDSLRELAGQKHLRTYLTPSLTSTPKRRSEEEREGLEACPSGLPLRFELIRQGLRLVASRFYGDRRPPTTRLFESTTTSWETNRSSTRASRIEVADRRQRGLGASPRGGAKARQQLLANLDPGPRRPFSAAMGCRPLLDHLPVPLRQRDFVRVSGDTVPERLDVVELLVGRELVESGGGGIAGRAMRQRLTGTFEQPVRQLGAPGVLPGASGSGREAQETPPAASGRSSRRPETLPGRFGQSSQPSATVPGRTGVGIRPDSCGKRKWRNLLAVKHIPSRGRRRRLRHVGG